MRLGHPSIAKLQRWLDGDQPSIDDHVKTCARCAGRIEHLADDSEALIGAALRELLVMPEEFPDRLQRRIDARLSARADLTLFSELFGLPFRAARVLSTTHEDDT